MKDLDDLLEKLDGIYSPIYVKGKEYPGNNPYILNKINNMLLAGRIKQEFGVLKDSIEPLFPTDLSWDGSRLRYDKDGEYLYYDELSDILRGIDEEYDRLWDEKVDARRAQND